VEPEGALAAFDAEVRRSVRADGSGARIEAGPLVVRWVGAEGRGLSGIAWSQLGDADADAVIAYRARLAAARGYRYLYVDASPDSRPILARLGFSRLARTTPYVWDPRAHA